MITCPGRSEVVEVVEVATTAERVVDSATKVGDVVEETAAVDSETALKMDVLEEDVVAVEVDVEAMDVVVVVVVDQHQPTAVPIAQAAVVVGVVL